MQAGPTSESSSPIGEPLLFETMVLGGGLPPEAERHLAEAGRCFYDSERAEAELRLAERLAPDHPAVWIGYYRYYFYKNRLDEALEVARTCLRTAAERCALPTDWQTVRPGDAEFDDFEAVLPRFYLFSLKAYAYLLLRLGRLEEGRGAIDKLLELDPSDKLGGKVLLAVIDEAARIAAGAEGDDT